MAACIYDNEQNNVTANTCLVDGSTNYFTNYNYCKAKFVDDQLLLDCSTKETCGRALCCEAKCNNEKESGCYDLANLPSDTNLTKAMNDHVFSKTHKCDIHCPDSCNVNTCNTVNVYSLSCPENDCDDCNLSTCEQAIKVVNYNNKYDNLSNNICKIDGDWLTIKQFCIDTEGDIS